MGAGAKATGDRSAALGRSSVASNTEAVALGNAANASGVSSFAASSNAIASGDNAIAIGNESTARGNNSTAIGNGASSVGNGTAVGYGANVSAVNATAFGISSKASGQSSLAVGHEAKASGSTSTAIGYGSIASEDYSIALGGSAVASGDRSLAVGAGAQALGSRSAAFGRLSVASGTEAVALGNNAQATVDGSVALGSNSITTNSVGNAVITNSSAPSSVVSVGTASNLRRIQNVADGAELQDAVTVAQLTTTQTNIKNIIGSSATVTNGNLATANIGGTGKNTIDDALKAVKTEVAQGKNTTVSNATGVNGQTIYTVNANSSSVTGSNAIVVSTGAKDTDGNVEYGVDLSADTKTDIQKGIDAKAAVDQVANTVTTKGLSFTADSGTAAEKKLGESVEILGDDNITTKTTANGVQVQLSKDLDLTGGSVSFGPTGPSISVAGINAEGKVISNVENGISAKDAVNVSQLDQAINDLITKGITTPISSDPLFIKGSSGSTYKVDPGSTLTVRGDKANTDFIESDAGKNIYTTVTTDGDVVIGLAKNVDLSEDGSVKVGTTKVSDGAVVGLSNTTIASNDFATTGRAATEEQLKQVIDSQTTLSSNAVQYNADKSEVVLAGSNGAKITNLVDGTVSSTSKDAVNGSQLQNVQDQVDQTKTDITNLTQQVNSAGVGLVKQAASKDEVTVAQNTGGTAVNISGTDGNRTITGVAEGINSFMQSM